MCRYIHLVVFHCFQCTKHGEDFVEYKCRYCCSIATYFCFGDTHFCTSCHDHAYRVRDGPRIPCPAGPQMKKLQGRCPLGFKHPPTGEEFCLGCRLCPSDNLILDRTCEEMETE